MILYLDTSTKECKVWLEGESTKSYTWESDRQLAKGLLFFLNDCLSNVGCSFNDLDGLAVFEGPGSFTGLRIGITVMNTIADSEKIPVVSASGKDWREVCRKKLTEGQDQKIILPYYGADANITTPKK